MRQVVAQTTTGRIENLKDAWGTSVDYVGEIKNKQPNGVGIAIYSNDFALRYAGNFVDGKYSGKGALLFKDGTFLSGDWKNGKLNGKGAYLNKDNDMYIGYFVDGKKEGYGTFIYADNGLLTGHMKNDTYEGRCIYIPGSGKTISDNIYSDGKKNGTGYQYEVDSKTLYEGTWNNGDWVSSGTASYYSFLKSSSFYAEKTDDQILMGGIDKNNNNLLQDTAFFYDLVKHSRYFGYCDKGYLSDGIIIKDSTRFIGKVNDDGAYGQCSFYKMKKFYDEGNYQKDYLSGSNNLSIDLKANTVYYGETAEKGLFSGHAWFVNNYNELYVGNYTEGKFNGTGYIVFKNGKTVRGEFKNGTTITATSVTDENGMPVNLKPKTIEEALSLITNDYKNNYEAFKGAEASVDDYPVLDYYSAYNSIVSFPGSVGENVIAEDYDFYLSYNATLYKGSSFAAARAKYDELCKVIAATGLHLKSSSAPVTLSGDVAAAKESATSRTKFTLENYSSLSDYNVYAEIKYADGEYKVSVITGDVKLDD
jgi:hypothetical protein